MKFWCACRRLIWLVMILSLAAIVELCGRTRKELVMCKGRTKRGKKLCVRGERVDGKRRDAVRGKRWMTWAQKTFPPSQRTKILATNC